MHHAVAAAREVMATLPRLLDDLRNRDLRAAWRGGAEGRARLLQHQDGARPLHLLRDDPSSPCRTASPARSRCRWCSRRRGRRGRDARGSPRSSTATSPAAPGGCAISSRPRREDRLRPYGVAADDSRRMIATRWTACAARTSSASGRAGRRERTREHESAIALRDKDRIWTSSTACRSHRPDQHLVGQDRGLADRADVPRAGLRGAGAQVLQPDDLGERHRHHVLRRALLPRRRLHAAPAEAHPHRLLLQELVAQDAGAHGHRAVPADLPARHGDVHLDELGVRARSRGTSRKRS